MFNSEKSNAILDHLFSIIHSLIEGLKIKRIKNTKGNKVSLSKHKSKCQNVWIYYLFFDIDSCYIK